VNEILLSEDTKAFLVAVVFIVVLAIAFLILELCFGEKDEPDSLKNINFENAEDHE